MPIPHTLSTTLADALSSLGCGVLLGAIYHLLRILIGYSKKSTFVRDIVFAPIAAVVCYSYAMTWGFYGSLRWYMLLSAGFGFLCYRYFVLVPVYPFEIKLRAVCRTVVSFLEKFSAGFLDNSYRNISKLFGKAFKKKKDS